MPLYEFRCTACEHRFEQLRPMSQATTAIECPKCQARAERILSSTAALTGGGSSARESSACGGRSGFT